MVYFNTNIFIDSYISKRFSVILQASVLLAFDGPNWNMLYSKDRPNRLKIKWIGNEIIHVILNVYN